MQPNRPDEIDWIAMTVAMEAEGEPWEGKLGVAWVLHNRSKAANLPATDIALAPWQFSAWNTDSTTRKRLAHLEDRVWTDSYKAACAAHFELVADPTGGAKFYLNPEATKAARPDGHLPGWAADPADPTLLDTHKILATIGKHVFLRG